MHHILMHLLGYKEFLSYAAYTPWVTKSHKSSSITLLVIMFASVLWTSLRHPDAPILVEPCLLEAVGSCLRQRNMDVKNAWDYCKKYHLEIMEMASDCKWYQQFCPVSSSMNIGSMASTLTRYTLCLILKEFPVLLSL